VTAVGSDVISWSTGSTISITLTDPAGNTSVYTTSPTSTSPSYFGAIATQGSIVQVVYTPGDETVGVDNFHFGQAEPNIPEPATMALLAGGLVALLRRRKR